VDASRLLADHLSELVILIQDVLVPLAVDGDEKAAGGVLGVAGSSGAVDRPVARGDERRDDVNRLLEVVDHLPLEVVELGFQKPFGARFRVDDGESPLVVGGEMEVGAGRGVDPAVIGRGSSTKKR